MTRIEAAALCLIALAAACGGASRTSPGATLEGTVRSSSSASLAVNVPGTSSATRTDAAGHFALLGVQAGATSLHFSGGSVDATLQLTALAEQEHRSIRVEVEGHDAREHHEESESKIHGAIESIAAPSFVASGRTVTTTTSTTLEKGGKTIAFADLTVGDSVEAEGALEADGSLLARSVKVEDPQQVETDGGMGEHNGPEEVEFTGALTAISGSTLTVGTTTVVIDASTRIEKADQILAASDLKLGDELHVDGTLGADAKVLAQEIKVLSADEEARVSVTGPVASIALADLTFTVGTTAVKTDAQTKFDGSGSFASLADLKVGDNVDVEAAQQADGSLLALRVHRLDKPEENEVEVKGAIEKLTATSIQVEGKTFAVDANTAIKQSGNQVALGSLIVGQIAEVRGSAAADGSLLATRISIESGH